MVKPWDATLFFYLWLIEIMVCIQKGNGVDPRESNNHTCFQLYKKPLN
jgi:hypothetical protein